MSVTAWILGLLVAVVPSWVAAGVPMELPVGPDIVAGAEYWPGEVGMPAVLLVHGFLQTREFPTVRRLAEALADEGFSVLTPSLSLGLSRRKQSVACEALHTHSMQQDMAELRAWTEWLTERTGRPPVLIGHSSGGAQLAAMLDANRKLQVDRSVLISLSYFGEEQGPQRVAELAARAAAAARRGDDEMHNFALTYCSKYVTTASNLLSYLDWDKERLRGALSRTASPVVVIYGDQDERIDRAWLQGLGGDGVTVRPVSGANHFFDLAHEFDLLDEVIQVITGGEHG